MLTRFRLFVPHTSSPLLVFPTLHHLTYFQPLRPPSSRRPQASSGNNHPLYIRGKLPAHQHFHNHPPFFVFPLGTSGSVILFCFAWSRPPPSPPQPIPTTCSFPLPLQTSLENNSTRLFSFTLASSVPTFNTLQKPFLPHHTARSAPADKRTATTIQSRNQPPLTTAKMPFFAKRDTVMPAHFKESADFFSDTGTLHASENSTKKTS